MKVEINHTLLTTSPYNGKDDESSSLFFFTESETENFAKDIVKLKEGCYKITGYRGSGKTSFLKKAYESFENLSDSKFIFIHVNILKHEKKEIILRKLVREFFLQFVKTNKYKDEKKKHEEKEKNTKKGINELVLKLSELYERTFYNVTHFKSRNKLFEKKTVFGYSVNVKDLALTIISLLVFTFGILINVLDICTCYLYNHIGLGASFLWALFQFIKITYQATTVNKEQELEGVKKESYYDDDVAEFLINELLSNFRKNGYEVVFILDELDKITPTKKINPLLENLKHTILSGNATFIIVGGQNLYYEYYFSEKTGDAVLSTLFNKSKHVSLLSSENFRAIFFDKILLNKDILTNPGNKKILETFVDKLIYKSERIPRKFITLIMEMINWPNENDKNQNAYILIGENQNELDYYENCSKILSLIEEIDDKYIRPYYYNEPFRDFAIIELFKKAKELTYER